MVVRIAAIVGYLAIIFLLAARARRQTSTLSDYYTGGGRIPTIFIVASFYATFVSTNTFIGHSGRSYVYGLSWLIVGVVLVVFTFGSWVLIAPRFREIAGKHASVVPSDLFSAHYRSENAGTIAAAVILFDSIFYLAAVFLGASESISALLGIPFLYALVGIFFVQIAYTAVGGYVADVWSDTLQAGVMVVATFVLPFTLVAKLGGWESTWRSLKTIDRQLLQAGETSYSLTAITTAAPLILIVGIALSGGLKFVSDPRQLSRFYGLRGRDAARSGVLTVTALVAVTYLLLLPLGLLARAYPLPDDIAARPDSIVPWLLGEGQVLGVVAGSIVLTALAAAAMSTVDSVLLVAAAALQKNVLPRFGALGAAPDVTKARLLVAAYALLPVILAAVAHANPGAGHGIVGLTAFAGALYAGAFLPGLIGMLYWPRASATGAIAGMVVAVVATTSWKYLVQAILPETKAFHEVFVGLVAGTLAFVIGSLFGRSRGAPSAETG